MELHEDHAAVWMLVGSVLCQYGHRIRGDFQMDVTMQRLNGL